MIFNWSSGPKGPRGASRMPPFARDTVPSPVNYKPQSGLRLEARRAERSQSHATFYRCTSRELQAAKRPATRGPKGREGQVVCRCLAIKWDVFKTDRLSEPRTQPTWTACQSNKPRHSLRPTVMPLPAAKSDYDVSIPLTDKPYSGTSFCGPERNPKA